MCDYNIFTPLSIFPQLNLSQSVPRHSSPVLTASTASSGVSAATASVTVLMGVTRKTAVRITYETSPRRPLAAPFAHPDLKPIGDDSCIAASASLGFHFHFQASVVLNKMSTVTLRCCLSNRAPLPNFPVGVGHWTNQSPFSGCVLAWRACRSQIFSSHYNEAQLGVSSTCSVIAG